MWRKAVALVLTLALLPMASEVVEMAAHYVSHGDFVHSADHAAPTEDEHGCTPLFHLCGCHTGVATSPAATSIALDFSATLVDGVPPSRHGRVQDPPPHLPPLA